MLTDDAFLALFFSAERSRRHQREDFNSGSSGLQQIILPVSRWLHQSYVKVYKLAISAAQLSEKLTCA
jgi:hypothetical protein